MHATVSRRVVSCALALGLLFTGATAWSSVGGNPAPPGPQPCPGSGSRICMNVPDTVGAGQTSTGLGCRIEEITNYSSQVTCKKNGVSVPVSITDTQTETQGSSILITYTIDISGFSKSSGDTLTWRWEVMDEDTWEEYYVTGNTSVTAE